MYGCESVRIYVFCILQVEATRAKFRNGATRLLTHAEAVAALNGTATEAAILSELFDQVLEAKRKVSRALVRYEGSRAFFYQHLIGAMCTHV